MRVTNECIDDACDLQKIFASVIRYCSSSSLPSVGLYFSGLDLFATTNCDGFGLPTRSRAISRTALLAVNVLFFFFLAAICASSHQGTQKCNNPRVSKRYG